MRFSAFLVLLVPLVLALHDATHSLQPLPEAEPQVSSAPDVPSFASSPEQPEQDQQASASDEFADADEERDESTYIEGDDQQNDDTTEDGHPAPVEFPDGHDVVHSSAIEDSEEVEGDDTEDVIEEEEEPESIADLKIPYLQFTNKTAIQSVVLELSKNRLNETPKKKETKGKHKDEKKIHIVLDDIIKSIESAFINYEKGENKIVVGYKGTRDKKFKALSQNTKKFEMRLKDLQNKRSTAATAKALAGDKFTSTKKALNTARGKVTEAKSELKKAQNSEAVKKAATIKAYNVKMSSLFKVALKDKSSYCEEYKFIEKLRGFVEKLNVDYTHVTIKDWTAQKNKRCRYRSCPKDADLPGCMVSGKFATALDCAKHCIAQSWCLAFEWTDAARGKKCYIYTNTDGCKTYGATGHHIYTIPSYISLGCWVDKAARAVPTLLWQGDSKKTIENCAASAKGKGWTTFSFQAGSQCFSGKDGTFDYKKYGKSTGCSNTGKGGSWANNVYSVTEKGFVSKLVTECSRCFCDGGNAATGNACDKPMAQKCTKCTVTGLKLSSGDVCLAYYPFAKKDYTSYAGYWFASLGGNSKSYYGRSMVDYGGYRCGSGWVAMPVGWHLAPDNSYSRYVTKKHYWYTSCTVTSSGRSYYTKRYGSYYAGRSCGCCYLRRSGTKYRVNSCNRVVLIRMKKPR